MIHSCCVISTFSLFWPFVALALWSIQAKRYLFVIDIAAFYLRIFFSCSLFVICDDCGCQIFVWLIAPLNH